jgi:ribonuclease HII
VTRLPPGATVRRDAGLYGYERALRRAGIDIIAGVDEAGRGACAGPLVAGAAILKPGKSGEIPGLADSKLLTEKARERCYAQIVRRALAWSVVVIDSEECDRLGMHVANVEALRRAVALLDVPPEYDFRTHKGYITDAHAAALSEHGPSPVHRMRFVNVRRAAGLEPPLEDLVGSTNVGVDARRGESA